jgi:archaellum component FlaF (FlaF/FlaG flagellin family)
MKHTITNNRNTKAVNISTDATGSVRAFYVQFTSNGEQVLQSKDFASVNNATKWANKILN